MGDRQLLHRTNHRLLGLLVFSSKNMGRCDTPLVCCAFSGGLSPLGILEADDAIDGSMVELTVDSD